MNEIKATLTATLNNLKSARDAKVNSEFARVRASEIVPKQNEIESSKTAAIAEVNKEHNTKIANIKAENDRKLQELNKEYNANIQAENESYSAMVSDLTSKAEAKKTEIEEVKKAEITAQVAAGYNSTISDLEATIAKLSD